MISRRIDINRHITTKHAGPTRRRATGFSLVELTVVAVIIMILASISVVLNQNEIRSSDTHALTNHIAAWLGEIALSPEESNTTCTVTFQPGTQLGPNSTIATVQPTSCATDGTLRVPGNSRLNAFNIGTSHNSWVYTERGAISSSTTVGASSTNTDIIIRVSVDGQPPLRCIRLSGIMGLIRFGVNSSSGNAITNTTCTDWKRT